MIVGTDWTAARGKMRLFEDVYVRLTCFDCVVDKDATMGRIEVEGS